MTTWLTTHPLAKRMDWAVRFHNTMETLRLPSLSSVYVLITYSLLGRSALWIGCLGPGSVPHHHHTLEATFLFLLMDWELPRASLVSQLVGSLLIVMLQQCYYVMLNILQQCYLCWRQNSVCVEMKILSSALPQYIWDICRHM